ncbi:mucolipin-2-like [Ylistrum balloti]|uniref:mucolipin-2-like n=1 Tax=Ylistrum balloti TaxID=509963 RepID=UPI002905AF14|nr:mucolipin-2-like [Ylistrum balloti]
MPYPPATGQYALYSIDEVTSHINYAIRKVGNTSCQLIIFFISNVNDSPVNLCVDYYDLGIYNMATNDIQFDQTRRKVCQDVGIHANNEYHLNLSTLDSMGGDNLNLSIPDLMKGDKGSLVRLIRVQIVFTVHSIHVNMESSDTSPRCFHIQGTIEFDNSDINGQIPIHLLSDASEMVCTVNGATSSSGEPSVFVLCSISILFTALSFVLSLRSVVTAIHLCCKTRKHIRTKFGTPLTLSEQLEIVNAKEFVTLIGDVISFCGFLFYIVLNSRVLRSSSALYDISGLLLGTGLILSCFGVLHFLSFSPGFHILFDVMGKSILPVLRFLLCAAVLFVAFALCGWIVMGPYHIKFSSIYSTFRCLFGLIAGDEVYVTLAAIGEDFSFSWWFCAVFITFYSIMFTIVALNILIAIFTASYDSIKSHTIRNRVKSTLIRFMNE